MASDDRYEVNQPDVIDETVDGEVLIVHLGTGTYYSTRGSGEAIWQLLAAGATVDEVVGAVNGDAAALDARAAVEAYVASLLEEGLLRPRSGSPVATAEGSTLAQFSQPLLEKYTDMQELLLLDPIHDVEETGWPNVKAGVLED